jgi:hypothetical protein
MAVLQEIERDLDWREAELAVLRLLLVNENVSEREKLVVFRAAWALLYAHYEGFCKFALTTYFDEVQRLRKPVSDLPSRMQAASLDRKMKTFRSLPTSDLIERACDFALHYLSEPAEFPDVDTRSNLWPETLHQLLADADIELESLPAHDRKLKTLVRRRNNIAHGERDMITEFDYYSSYESAVKVVMYDLALTIENKIDTLVAT